MTRARLVLELLHGRDDPTEALPDWGVDGPIFRVCWVHVTYFSELTIGLEEPTNEGHLPCVEGHVCYGGVFYGDWTVHPIAAITADPTLAARVRPYLARNAVVPDTASHPEARSIP